MQKITTPGGEVLVVLPLADYEALIDAADVAAAEKVKADVAAGRDEMVPAEVASRLIAGESPMRVWREHRKLTSKALSDLTGLSPGYLSEIESGSKPGGIATLGKIAKALGVTIDDLVA